MLKVLLRHRYLLLLVKEEQQSIMFCYLLQIVIYLLQNSFNLFSKHILVVWKVN